MIKPVVDAEKLKKALSKSVDQAEKAGLATLKDVVESIKSRMKEAGRAVRRPITWDSLKQKIFVLIMLRKRGELPYIRKDKYRNGWKSEHSTRGSKLQNAHPAGAIGGMISGWQSKIHRGTWNNLLAVKTAEVAKLPKKLIDNLKIYVRSDA